MKLLLFCLAGIAGAILLGWFLRVPAAWMWWQTMFTYGACWVFLGIYLWGENNVPPNSNVPERERYP